MSESDWAVFRQDFSGNEFLVEQGLTEERAHKLVAEFESHKHHQHYWARRLPESSIDYSQLLRDSLNSGSTLDASLQVLRNQNSSIIQCIKAVREVRGLSLGESKRVVFQSPAFADKVELHDSFVEKALDAFDAELDDEP